MRDTHRALTEGELRQLAACPLIEIGGHTVSHPLLAACSREEQQAEITGGRDRLEELIGKAVRSFAYPFGTPADYTAATIDLVREAGFEQACSNFEGAVTSDTDCFQLPRLMVLPHWSADELDGRLERLAAA